MNRAAHAESEIAFSRPFQAGAGAFAKKAPRVEEELACYLPHLSRMSEQLRQTSTQIETSVVEVCTSFQGIAERAKEAVTRTSGFLRQDGDSATGSRSFESLIESCSGTLVKILNVTEEAGEISRRAVERIQQMDKASETISAALQQLERIAVGNKVLALNARIEAARAGRYGAGFAVVAMEVIAQTERSQKVNAQVSGLIANLRTLAGSTLDDLQRMNDSDRHRVDQCRIEVNESLRDLQAAHGEMKTMLTGMSEENALLATDIGAAVRGLQFQDRTNQRISHVVEDLNTLHDKLASRFSHIAVAGAASVDGFSDYTMYEERVVAGMQDVESTAGDVELF
jgi:methyl-accepting chemotaxis protein